MKKHDEPFLPLTMRIWEYLVPHFPYTILATTSAFVGEQVVGATSLGTDVTIAGVTGTTLVTLEHIAAAATQRNEPLSYKIARGTLTAGIATPVLLGIGMLAAERPDHGAYSVFGAVLGYAALKFGNEIAVFKDTKKTIGGIAQGIKKRAHDISLATGCFLMSGIIFSGISFAAYALVQKVGETNFQVQKVFALEETKPSLEEKKEFALFTQWPVQEIPYISSCHGFRLDTYERAKKKGIQATLHHAAVDIRAKAGENVYPVKDGIVTEVDPITWGRVRVEHDLEISTEYLHCDRTLVSRGDQVREGETVLCHAGGRGPKGRKYYRPHVHFRVIDPHVEDTGLAADAIFYDNAVNALCYFDLVRLNVGISSRSGCNTQGGPNKFCTDYLAQEMQRAASEDTNKGVQQTLAKKRMDTIYETYGTTINAAVQGTPAYSAQLLGIIAVESAGVADAKGHGTRGIMQFEAPTAYGVGLCDNKFCVGRDDRLDPEKAITAGGEHLGNLHLYYNELPAQDELSLVGWNAGRGVSDATLRKTRDALMIQDPSWEYIEAQISGSLICSVSDYKRWPKKACEQKAGIVKDFVSDVMLYVKSIEEM